MSQSNVTAALLAKSLTTREREISSSDQTVKDEILSLAQKFLNWAKAELAASSVENVTDALAEAKRWSGLVRAGTKAGNIYAHAHLLIVARIGQLSPRKSPGRPKKLVAYPSVKQNYGFSRPTLADYRKVGENASRIDEYVEKVKKYNGTKPESTVRR